MIRIFASALFAGLAAGLISALLQFGLLTHTLLEGERYETGELTHFTGGHAEAGESHAEHEHGAAQEGLARHVKTVAMSVVTFTGYALVLVALFASVQLSGREIGPREGLLWGLAGFAAVMLLPSIGLPPELPGTPAEDITLRQYWWIATVLASAVGLGLVFLSPSPARVGIGLVLLVAPHVFGAPELSYYGGTAPPELAGKFVARSLAVGAASWLALGFATGLFWRRFRHLAPEEARA
jgi:cobalt transporter subunit CbtA